MLAYIDLYIDLIDQDVDYFARSIMSKDKRSKKYNREMSAEAHKLLIEVANKAVGELNV